MGGAKPRRTSEFTAPPALAGVLLGADSEFYESEPFPPGEAARRAGFDRGTSGKPNTLGAW